MLPPPCTLDWVCNAPDNWIGRALRKDQQAAGLLPPKLPGGPILLGACTHVECAYQDWKWAVNELWEDKRHCLQTAAHQRHLNKETARKCQEANHHQQLLGERAAYKCQEAARCQRLLDEETACHQHLLNKFAARRLMAKRAALARQMVAAQTIFLWLCRCHLCVWLARQTLRQQQCEAALARLRYKQDCCSRAALAEEQRRQAAAAQAKALADEADKWRWQDALAAEQRRQESAERTAATAELALAEEGPRQESAKRAAETAEKAMAAEQRRQESAERAAATAEKLLAAVQCRRESAQCTATLAELALAEE